MRRGDIFLFGHFVEAVLLPTSHENVEALTASGGPSPDKSAREDPRVYIRTGTCSTPKTMGSDEREFLLN